MNLAETADAITDYLLDDRFKQAVLINGDWGTGKTYFANEILTTKIQHKGYDIIRYSLYGANSCEQIKNDINSEILIHIVGKKSRIPDKALHFAPYIFEIVAKKLEIDFDNVEKWTENIDFDTSKFVIIFDDLERATTEINDILGLINSFVENEKMKVVILANENEIGSSRISSDLPGKFYIAKDKNIILPDEKSGYTQHSHQEVKTGLKYDQLIERTKSIFSKDIVYNSIKEKLIGLSISLTVDFYEVYGNIINDYARNSSTKQMLTKFKGVALDLFQLENCRNLRTLIFAVITFDKICTALNDLSEPGCTIEYNIEEYNKAFDNLLKEILKYVIFESIKYKAGSNLSKNEKSESSLHLSSRIHAGMSEFKFVYLLIHFHEFNAVEVRNFVSDKIKSMLEDQNEEQEKNNLSFYRLCSWEWINLSDKKVIENTNQLFAELKSERYDTRFFKHIIVFLLQLDLNFQEKLEEVEHKKDEYIALMKTYVINHEINYELLDQLELFDVDNEFGKKYNKLVEPLISAFNDKKFASQQKNFENLFAGDDWENRFHKFCEENLDSFLKNKSFLSSIPFSAMNERLKYASNIQLKQFTSDICHIYNFSNLHEFYHTDAPILEEIICKFKDMAQNCDCTTKLTLNLCIDRLSRKLDLLK